MSNYAEYVCRFYEMFIREPESKFILSAGRSVGKTRMATELMTYQARMGIVARRKCALSKRKWQ